VDEIEVEERQITEEHKSVSCIEEGEQWSQEIVRPPTSEREVYTQREPEETSGGVHQVIPSSFLFQNAKPGENIKISEILRKNANAFHMP
jgi:hypothetical protein